jgi:hypothetical protein
MNNSSEHHTTHMNNTRSAVFENFKQQLSHHSKPNQTQTRGKPGGWHNSTTHALKTLTFVRRKTLVAQAFVFPSKPCALQMLVFPDSASLVLVRSLLPRAALCPPQIYAK